MVMNDPVNDYLTSLLSDTGAVPGQHVNWDSLLSGAVNSSRLQESLDSCSLAPGFAPLCLLQPGEGNQADRRVQLFHILHHVTALPYGPLRRCMLTVARPFAGEARHV